jgi:hypothetical protein
MKKKKIELTNEEKELLEDVFVYFIGAFPGSIAEDAKKLKKRLDEINLVLRHLKNFANSGLFGEEK